MTMKALSIWQPYASLLAIGAKQYETRSWAPPQTLQPGDHVAIHAAKGHSRDGWDQLHACYAADAAFWALDCEHLHDETGMLPLGAVVAVATFAGHWPITILSDTETMLSLQERKWGDFSAGRYGWRFTPLLVLPKPIPARGRQGLWEWDEPRWLARALELM